MLKPFLTGFFAKIISGFDDTAVHTPLVAIFTKTRIGKIAFAIGMFLALLIIIFIADLISGLILAFPYHRLISAIILFALAVVIYLDIIVHIPRKKAEENIKKTKRITARRFRNLVFTGFVTFFATAIDDSIIYSSILAEQPQFKSLVITGIILAALSELIVIVYFSKRLAKLRYKSEITATGLVVLGLLILFKVI